MNKKMMKPFLLLFATLLYGAMLSAQSTINVEGTVTDATGSKPLPAVSVTVKGTSKGTSTDDKGHYRLTGVSPTATLIFSSIGFKEQSVAVNGKTTVNVSLQTGEASTLDQVIVIGYGTSTKKDLTGAVSQVKVAQLENENPVNVQDALRGNVPGLNISQVNSASAKGGGDLQIRGRSSINAGTTPLIVVDGVIYYGSLSDITPNDISTIDVLKDASS
ncbi:MAG: carboxypeptidase-like regulatory domain-containing protein, partial [Ilyomonas sp.]